MISPRVLRWSLHLAAYDYILEYKQGKQIMNVDVQNRLPQNRLEFEFSWTLDVLLLETALVTQIDANLLATATRKDPVLSSILFGPYLVGLQKWLKIYSSYISVDDLKLQFIKIMFCGEIE